MYEVVGKEIPNYFNVPFWHGLGFWMNCKNYGIPANNWRKLTRQQLAVLNLFNKLNSAKE